MASGAISFVLNRKSDWFDGSITKNLEFKDESLVLNNKNGENGIYISKAFDSMQDETVWHRMRLNISAPSRAIYMLKIYTVQVILKHLEDGLNIYMHNLEIK